ncbi:hypothetical protein D3C79_904830 [compost metagenome]
MVWSVLNTRCPVRAKECAEARGKGHAGFGIGLGLVDAGNLIFNRVFNSRDVNIRSIETGKDAK